MKFSTSERMVMEVLWDGKCLDENGEIQAAKLAVVLKEKYNWGNSSIYTFFSRLLAKGAIARRYPKYTLKPIVTREEGLEEETSEIINKFFGGSVVNIVAAFLNEKKVSDEELDMMKKLLDDFDEEK